MAGNERKLSQFMHTVFNWDWQDYIEAEDDDNYSASESIVFSVIRSAVMQKMDAIKIALNRLDGKLKTPIIMEYPKVFHLYPNAKYVEGSDTPIEETPVEPVKPDAPITDVAIQGEIVHLKAVPEDENGDMFELLSDTPIEELTLRQTIDKMSDFPRETPKAIVEQAHNIEMAIRRHQPVPDLHPKVKSVVAAHLILMAQNRDLQAIYEVFDQVEGKLAETFKILGPNEDEDIFITQYSTVAPKGAYRNEDGILMIEATESQAIWENKLKEGTRGA